MEIPEGLEVAEGTRRNGIKREAIGYDFNLKLTLEKTIENLVSIYLKKRQQTDFECSLEHFFNEPIKTIRSITARSFVHRFSLVYLFQLTYHVVDFNFTRTMI